jgi:hypothetical protein
MPISRYRYKDITNGGEKVFCDAEPVTKLEEEHVILEAENKLLRQLLWLRHGCELPALYGDDGCMQCSRCRIDFKEMPAEAIKSRFELIGRKEIEQVLKEKSL